MKPKKESTGVQDAIELALGAGSPAAADESEQDTSGAKSYSGTFRNHKLELEAIEEKPAEAEAEPEKNVATYGELARTDKKVADNPSVTPKPVPKRPKRTANSGNRVGQVRKCETVGEVRKSEAAGRVRKSEAKNRKWVILSLAVAVLVVGGTGAYFGLVDARSNAPAAVVEPPLQPLNPHIVATREKLYELNQKTMLWMIQYGASFNPVRVKLSRVRADFGLTSDQMLDSWGTPIRYEATDTSYTLKAAGPDKSFGTEDDLVQTRPI